MKSTTKFSYTVNGNQTCPGFAAITFGQDTLSCLEAMLDCLDEMRKASISATSMMGNRITVSKEG